MVEVKLTRSEDDCTFWKHCMSYGLPSIDKCIYHERKEKGEIGLQCQFYKGSVVSRQTKAKCDCYAERFDEETKAIIGDLI